MARFIIRRLIYTFAMIAAMSVFIFGLSRAAGDPRFLFLNEYTTQDEWEQWGRRMGLDRPLIVQYGVWASKAIRGDFGVGLRDHKDAMEVVWARVGATLQLSLVAIVLAVGIAVPLGILSSVKRGTGLDYMGRIFALLGQSMPGFWLGIMLIVIFSVYFGWLPTSGRGGLSHFVLPAITLGWGSAAGLLRLIRSSMLEVLDSEYIKFARSKGVNQGKVIWKHAFKNALIAPLTYSGLIIAGFITGSVITETVFAWPGLGRLAVDAVNNNDFPVMIASVALFTIMYVGAAFAVDVLYAIVDPRIRYD